MRKFSLIVAATVPDFGIGLNGSIPWKIKEDLKFFRETTTTTKDNTKQNAVIMGRKTWESIPNKYRPLPSRLNIVLTRNPKSDIAKSIHSMDSTIISSSFEHAMECLSWPPYCDNIESIYVIGGSEIYNLCIKNYFNNIHAIYLTQIFNNKDIIKCDKFLNISWDKYNPIALSDKKQCKSNESFEYQIFQLLPIINKSDKENESNTANNATTEQKISETIDSTHEEYQYLNLIKKILSEGVKRGDRTGTGTLSIFGAQMRFNLSNNIFPLLTTKRVFWRGVAEELLWFMNGSTSAKLLQEKRVRIWDGNSTREFLDGRGLNHYEVGDLGPVYGFQWRHFGAEYGSMHDDYKGKGVDQLMQCINMIKNNPNSRRIVMTAWNPSDLNKMALPPCHMFVQFYVANGKLSAQMYQRSADMGLGVPFNIASYALLTRIIAQICDLEAGEFVHTIGDAHVYLNHVEPLKEQLKRVPMKFPILKINPNKKNVDEFEYKDFKVVGYKSHKTIKMKMA
eukprot:940855_1